MKCREFPFIDSNFPKWKQKLENKMKNRNRQLVTEFEMLQGEDTHDKFL